MRKQFALLSSIVILILLAACTRAPQPITEPTAVLTAEPTTLPSPTQTEAQPTPTTAPTETSEPPSPAISAETASDVKEFRSMELPVDPAGVIWTLDGSAVAVTVYKGLVLIDAETLEVLEQVNLPENENFVDFSPDGHSLAKTTNFQTILITDIFSGEVTATIDPGVQFVGASFSPDGSQLVVASGEQWAGMIYDVASGTLVNAVTGFETAAPVYNVRFSSDGANLVWMARGSIQVEKISTQTLGADIGHEDFITAFDLRNTGTMLATAAGGTHDGEFTPLVFLWDPTSGEKLMELVQPQPAYCTRFSPETSLLAVCAGDNLLLWDPTSQTQVFSAAAHAGGIWDARFSPDGSTLATVGADRWLRFWLED